MMKRNQGQQGQQGQDRAARQPSRTQVTRLISEIEALAGNDFGWIMTGYTSAHDAGDDPHMAAWLACRAVGRVELVKALGDAQHFLDVVGELEIEFGDIPDTSEWPQPTWSRWLHLAISDLVRIPSDWRGGPEPQPAMHQ